jgi:hypothetical protein
VSGVINVGLNVILIPRIGLYGPPISTIASYVTVFAIRAYDSRKLVPFRINYRKLVVSNILLIGMLGILLTETNLATHPALYYLVFVLFCAVFVINVNSISSVFYKVLPKSVADKICGLSNKQLAVGTIGAVAFIGLNLLLKFIPLYIVCALGFLYGIKRRSKVISPCCLLCINILLSITVNIWLGIFLTCVEMLICIFALRKQIANLAVRLASKKR